MDKLEELLDFLDELKSYREVLTKTDSKLPEYKLEYEKLLKDKSWADFLAKYPLLQKYSSRISKEELREEVKEELREKLVRKAGALKGKIIELTGHQYAEGPLTGRFDIWAEAFNTTAMSADRTALAFCIDAVNEAIGKLEGEIKQGIRDKQGKLIGELPKDTAESPVNLFDKMQFHPRVIEVSESLFKTDNYSSAIFEAFKAVHNYVQDKTGLTLDGVNLMEKVFNENKPILQLNELLTKSDRDEQKGFKDLFMGSQMGIRNPQAHENVKPEEQNIALEYLGIASLLMRRIDGSKLVKLNI